MTTEQVAPAGSRRAAGEPDTLPRMLLAHATGSPERPALRVKQLGIWHTVTWSQLALRVEAVAVGLHELGVGRGDVVLVLSDNRPEWMVAELAAQSLQAAVVGPHPECSTAELVGVVGATGARVLLVEDQRQLEKVQDAGAPLGDLPVLCLDVRGVPVGPGARVRAFAELEAGGRAAARPGWWRQRVDAGRGTDVAVLCLPAAASATVEDLLAPAPVPLTHAGLCASSASLSAARPPQDGLRYVSALPLGWSWEQVAGVTGALQAGSALCLPEGPATQLQDLREVGPGVLLAPARAWEAMADELQAAAAGAGPLGGAAFRWARRSTGTVRRVADALVLRSVRSRVGLGRLERAWSFGAVLREDVQAFFAEIGVDLRQLYGLDAAGGPVAGQVAAPAVPGTVGTPLPGVEVQLSPDGEVLVRSGAVPPDRLAPDGWLHTGDRARWADGRLVVEDRAGDLLLVGGVPLSPSRVEAQLRASRYVEDAVVVARPAPAAGSSLAALVVLDAQTVTAWAEQQRLHAAGYEDLTRLPEVEDLVRGELARVGRALPGGVALRSGIVLPRRLDLDLGEKTRTLVVRRRVVLRHFPAQAAALGVAPGLPEARAVRVLDVPEPAG